LVGAVTASIDPFAVGGVGLVGAGVEGGFGFGRVVAAPHAIKAVAEPRSSPKPTKRTMELAPVAGAGLVRAGHETL